MKKIALLTFWVVASAALAQTTKPKSPADIFIGRTTESYEKAIGDANAGYQKAVAPVLKRYGGFRDRKILAAGNSAIKRLEAARKGASELDGIRMEQEIEKIRKSLDEKVGDAPKVARKGSILEVCGLKYKGHSYLPVYKQVTWKEANALCKKMGGHLAYIETAGEMKALTAVHNGKNTKAAFWVGATSNKGVWKWGNRKPVNPELWKTGKTGDPSRPCARFSNGDLHPARENEKYLLVGFICEWE